MDSALEIDGMPVDIIRSRKRTKTVQARIDHGRIIVRIPARLTKAQEAAAVSDIVGRLSAKRASVPRSDKDLEDRARRLNVTYLESRARPTSVRWVSNQHTRWGSCTPSTGTIRLSDRLRAVPDYVLDAVLIHELVHTFIPGHSAEFWSWARRAPQWERADGYLEAYQRWG